MQPREFDDGEPIAPHLRKTGLLLRASASDLSALVQQNVITRERLQRYGFLLVQGAGGAPEALPGETALKDDTKMQLIHRDLPPEPDTMAVVALRFPRQERQRGAYTVIGDSRAVLRTMVATLLANQETQPHQLISQLQEDARGLDPETLEPDTPHPSGVSWSQAVLFDLSNTVRASGYPDTLALYSELAADLHFHAWQPDQLLVLNDDGMAHGRLPIARADRTKTGGIAYRSQWTWQQEQAVPTLWAKR